MCRQLIPGEVFGGLRHCLPVLHGKLCHGNMPLDGLSKCVKIFNRLAPPMRIKKMSAIEWSKRELTESDIRRRLADEIWRGYLILALIGAPISAASVLSSGWTPVAVAHLFLASLFVPMYVNRGRFPIGGKATIAVVLPLLAGIPALWTFGFYSAGILWFAISCFVAAALCPRRVVVWVIGFEAACLLMIASAFMGSWLDLARDANAYIREAQAWVGVLTGAVVGIAILVHAVVTYNQSILSLLLTIQEQHDLIRHQATHDMLTGLPAAQLARDRLWMACHQATRNKSNVAVLIVDLEGFKKVNDAFGLAAGDHALKMVGSRLANAIRSVDTAARLGGDRFLVILSGIASPGDAEEIARKLVKVIAEPIRFDGHLLDIGAIVGIAVFPLHAGTPEDMLRCADQAMFAVKQSGKNNIGIFSNEAAPIALF